ncbi:oligosaccharide flippase family protein [Shouchella sp. 1P09AA]|uniref:oligosaccharide flippase family protein n=1 Tax=unclassified Shouchella TaxID=2893065 RepID=UPI0039A23DD5
MLTKHAFAYLLSHGIPAIVGFLGIAIYSRILSPEQYGQFALIFANAAIVNAVVFEWLKVSVLRMQKQRDVGETTYYMTIKVAFIALIVISFLIGIALMLFSNFLSPSFLLLVLLLSWCQSWYQLNLSLLRAELNPMGYGKMAFIRAITGLLFATLLITLDYGAFGLVVGLIIGLLLAVVPMNFKRWGVFVKPAQVNSTLLKQFAGYGLPLTITLLLGIIIHHSDRLIIHAMVGVEATGQYAIAYDLTEQSIFTLMLIINLAAFPIAVRALENRGEQAAKAQVRKNTRLLLGVGIPATIGFILLKDVMATVFLGAAFQETAIVLIPYIAIGALLKGMKLYAVDIVFHLTKQTKLQVIPVLVAATVNVALTIILIPSYGLEGAAMATVVAYAFAIISSWLLLMKQQTTIPFPVKDFVKILFASAIMALSALPFAGDERLVISLLQVFVAGLTYCFVCGCLYFKDLKNMFLKKKANKNQHT